MNKIKTIIIAIIIIIFIVGGFYLWQKDQVAQPVTQETNKLDITKTLTEDNLIKSGPISYSITDVSVSISTTTAPFGFTIDQFKSMAKECGAQHEVGYFDKLVAKFKGVSKIIYNFKYQGISQDTGIFMVMLLPNRAGYTSIDQFKNDFNLCYAGGDTYPLMLNSDWLLFVNACGTGYDDDSGRPNGCEEIRKIVEPSLKLN